MSEIEERTRVFLPVNKEIPGCGTCIFAVPASAGACGNTWNEILVHQLDSRHLSCNSVELMPRLKEQLG